MYLFLLSFFALYSLLHLYLLLKVKRAFGLKAKGVVVLSAFMALMIVAPLLVRVSEKYGWEQIPFLLAWTGYTWLGLIFLGVCSFLLLDLYQILAVLVRKGLKKKPNFWVLSPRAAFYLSLLTALSIAFYGFFEARNIRVEQVDLVSPKIPRAVGKIRIIQISDIHLGLMVGKERLKSILDTVQKADGDILVSTGDLVDGQRNNLRELSRFFKEIRPRLGKYAVTGNHEFYAGLDQALLFLEEAGFTVLRGQAVTVAGVLSIAGVDDKAGAYYHRIQGPPEAELLKGLSRKNFTLLLKHRPETEIKSLGLFDLQLSGHTHNGQIFPFRLITRLFFPMDAGFFRLTGNAFLYSSRGTGTWGPPIRFLSPPEITVITLKAQAFSS